MKNYTASSSKLAKSETNDCVVRALAVGFGWSYAKSYKFCSNILEREPKQGVYEVPYKLIKFSSLLEQEYGVKLKRTITETWDHKKEMFKDTWVKQFIKDYPQGTFIILGVDHCWVIQDGIIKDWPELKPKVYRTIIAAFQVL
jgi:hypothetical protein